MSLVCNEKPFFGPYFDEKIRGCLFLDRPGTSLISGHGFGTDVLPALKEEILSGRQTEHSYYQIKNSITLWESRESGSVIRMIEEIMIQKLDTFLVALNCSAPLTFERFVQLWDHYKEFYQRIETILGVFFPLTAKSCDASGISLIDLIGYGIFYQKIFLHTDSSVPLFDPSIGFGDLSSDAQTQMAQLYRNICKFGKTILTIHDFALTSRDSTYSDHVAILKSTLEALGAYRPAVEAVVKEIDTILVRTKDHQRISNADYAEIMEWASILAHDTSAGKIPLVHACYLKYFQVRLLNHPRKNYKIEIATVSKLNIGSRGYSIVEQIRDVERSGKIKTRLHGMKILTGDEYVGLECEVSRCSPYYLRNKLWKISRAIPRIEIKPPPVIEYYLKTAERAYFGSVRRSDETPTRLEWEYLHGHATFDLSLGRHSIQVRAHMIQAMVIGHFGDVHEIPIETLEEDTGIPHEMMLKIVASLTEAGLFYVNQETQALTIYLNNDGLQRDLDLTPLYLNHFSH